MQMVEMQTQLQQAVDHATSCQTSCTHAESEMQAAQQRAERWRTQCDALQTQLQESTKLAAEREQSRLSTIIAREQEIAALKQDMVCQHALQL